MTKKAFISSTCYDLQDVRTSLEDWARNRGFETLLSDRAAFPVDPTIHRHDICLANAKAADLVILVIAGRLGAPYYADTTISATWAEFRAASQAGVPIIVCVDRRVWDERDAYRRDPTTPLKVTKDPKTFEFLSEINAAPQGYWMEIYADSAQILKRLDSLVELFPVSLHSTGQGVRRDGKYIVASSLSAEAQHHVRLVIGSNEFLSDDDLTRAKLAIPREAQVETEPPHELHGFSVLVARTSSKEDTSYVVRATPIGDAIYEELLFASILL